ncbi:MAG: hydroxylamine oxidation protein HaoB [Pseudaminobacter sp.]
MGGRSLGFALAAVGAGLLGWVGWQMMQPVPSPYAIVAAPDAQALVKDVDFTLPDGYSSHGYEVRVEGVKEPVARFVAFGRDGKPEGVLAWRNEMQSAVLTADIDPAEALAVAEAVRKYAPEDAVLIGLGDAANRLSVLTGHKSLVATGGLEPVLVPDIWRDRSAVVVETARDFFATPGEGGFETTDIAEALLSDEMMGAARLAAAAGEKPAFLILHLTDVLRLGELYPDRFSIGYRDFPGATGSHALMKTVSTWLKEQGYHGYAIEPRTADVVRVYFLANAQAGGTLLAQALPFTTSNPMDLDVLDLVYQRGGTWIYRLKPIVPAASD